MNTQALPKTYKGYSTAELLDILERIPGGHAKNIPWDMAVAVQDLAMEYELTPVARLVAAKARRVSEASRNLT